MKMNALVSVIVPVYNGERYIFNCMQSLIGQTYSYMEVIFVNDGSTDRTDELLKKAIKELQNEGRKCIYLYQENSGAASAVNTALKYVRGKYLMLFDVDDILMPDAVRLKAEFLENHPDYGMVRNNGYYNKSDKINDNSYLFVRTAKEKNEENIFESILLGRTNNWPSTFMVNTEMLFSHLKDKEIYISPYGQNMQLMLPIAYYYKSGFIDKPLMRYVSYGESASRTMDKRKQLNLINGFEQNRLGIIDLMDISECEKEKWKYKIQLFYLHIRLKFAFQIDDKIMMKEMYEQIKLKNDISCQDKRMMFYAKHKKIRIIILYIQRYFGLFDAFVQHLQGHLLRRGKDVTTFNFR